MNQGNVDNSGAARHSHVHELQGSAKTAEENDPHGHRFCTVTGEVIPIGANDHVHEVSFHTDFHNDHYHEFRGRTGGVIQVGDGHVHYIQSETSNNDNHSHEFNAVTALNNPTGGRPAKEAAFYEDEYPYEKYPNEDYPYEENYKYDSFNNENPYGYWEENNRRF